jgi:Arc/MetJ family transcription regulator
MVVELDKEGDQLLAKAQELGGHKTTHDAISEALKEYVRIREQRRIAELFGKIEYDEDYDYKAQRRRP